MVGAYSRCIFVEKYKNKEDTLVGTGTSGGALGSLERTSSDPSQFGEIVRPLFFLRANKKSSCVITSSSC